MFTIIRYTSGFKIFLLLPVFILTFLCLITVLAFQHSKVMPVAHPLTRIQMEQSYGHLPLAFEPNLGQTDPKVKFLSRGGGYSLYLTGSEAVLLLNKKVEKYPLHPTNHFSVPARAPAPDIMRIQLKGVSEGVSFEGLEPLPGISNYFIGSDSSKWITKIPQYGKVQFHEVYPGVDMAYYGNQRKLEYDFVVKPGGDPSVIRLHYEGVDSAQVDEQGNLQLFIKGRRVAFKAPDVYQEDHGVRKTLKGKYFDFGDRESGFEIESYNKTQNLIIDPVLDYGTYLGGAGGDNGSGIAVDNAGEAYVTGSTTGGFPTTAGVYEPGFGGGTDVFVSKFNSTGSALLFSTYLGGSGNDAGNGIVLDASGDPYVTGSTTGNFPITPGAYQTVMAGDGGDPNFGDAFFSKLNSTGTSLLYSTYIGGSQWDSGQSIGVDAAGVGYIAGWTTSTNFPTTPGAFKPVYGAGDQEDFFVSKINPAGGGASDLIYSTFLGESYGNVFPQEDVNILIDGSADAYVAGGSRGKNFTTTAGAFETTLIPGDIGDNFILKLNPAGSGLVFSTYVGPSGGYGGYGMVLDSSGDIYLAATSASTNYPTTPGAYSPTYIGGLDGVVAELNPNGSSLLYSTYLEQAWTTDESWAAYAKAIAVDSCGDIYVVGGTSYSAFPITSDAFESTTDASGFTGFLMVLNPSLVGAAQLVFSTFLGTEGGFCYGLVQDPSGNLYATGYTTGGFPVSAGAYQTEDGGGQDAFAAKIDISSICAVTATPTATPTNTSTSTATNTPTPMLSPTSTPTATPTVCVSQFFISKNIFMPSQGSLNISVNACNYPGNFVLKIYNSAGEHVKTLDSKSLTGNFQNTYNWDGTNKYGTACATGVYILFLEEPFGVQSARIALVR